MIKSESIIKELYDFAKHNSESSPLELKEIQLEFNIDITKMLDYQPNHWIGRSLIIHVLGQDISDKLFPQLKISSISWENPILIHIYETIKDDKITDILQMSIQWNGNNTTSYKCKLTNNSNDSITNSILNFKWSNSIVIMKGYRPNNLGDYINLERLNTKLLKLFFNVDLDSLDLRNPYDNELKEPNSVKPIEIKIG